MAAACAPGPLICVATDLSLPTETIRTMTAAQWKTAAAPDFHKKPTVFLLLAQ
jgi:16S rRNA (cytidine1402-2'-O)-methyltransferase